MLICCWAVDHTTIKLPSCAGVLPLHALHHIPASAMSNLLIIESVQTQASGHIWTAGAIQKHVVDETGTSLVRCRTRLDWVS